MNVSIKENIYEPTIRQGFLSASFWESMEWKRDCSSITFQQDEAIKYAKQNFLQFCEKVKRSPSPDYKNPPTHYSIPPIIHFIWLGSPLSAKAHTSVKSWEKYHPNWEIKIWTDTETDRFSWSSPRTQVAFKIAKTWAEKADLLRLEVLYQFGGIYSDTDVICLNFFHDLLVQDITFFSCFELNYINQYYGEAFYIGTAVMGAAKGCLVIKHCLDRFKTHQEAPDAGILRRTGPGLVSRSCKATLLDPEENILILPCSYLYPLPYESKWISNEKTLESISQESLALHLWDSSWHG